MKLTNIQDLIGKDVAGLMADIRSRNADGSLKITFENPRDEHNNRPNVPLTRVYWKRENGKRWLHWEWDKRGLDMPMSCGYSGIREDSKEINDYYILVEDRA